MWVLSVDIELDVRGMNHEARQGTIDGTISKIITYFYAITIGEGYQYRLIILWVEISPRVEDIFNIQRFCIHVTYNL